VKSIACLILMLCCSAAFAEGTAPSHTADIAAAREAILEGDVAAAIARLENMPSDTAGWEQHFWLGSAYLLDGRVEHAGDALDRALAMEGEVASIWVQRAVVEQELGRYPVALQFLDIAAEVDRDYAMTYLNAGQAYESLGQWEKARSAYGQFLKLSSRDGSARLLRLRREIIQRVVASDTAGR